MGARPAVAALVFGAWAVATGIWDDYHEPAPAQAWLAIQSFYYPIVNGTVEYVRKGPFTTERECLRWARPTAANSRFARLTSAGL